MSQNGVWEFAGKTDPGCVRANNEDGLAIDEDLGLLIVADGMGGHNSGEVASELAISTIRSFARRMLGGEKTMVALGGDPLLSARAQLLEHFVESANTMIFEKGRAFPRDAGMGTTVVAVLVDQKSVAVAHVGDSRLYLFRGGVLSQLTEDHSLVGDQLRRGLITPEAAAHSTLQNILTRALGAESIVKVDVAEHPVFPGDILILSTDGLDKMVSDEEVANVLREDSTPARVVDVLVRLARQAGGTDNITVVCARLGSSRPQGLWGKMSGFLQGRP
ncbi:MAG TPA: Stp1/IreP family PP2C-type Ser/Thr phosphatase [Elusimicrobia bacterium]|nr:Stp1/IreP family PP2C-type Ser/Thr phosphatase [Elusimicrobiota bacterium]HBT62927.1 Stp1/IreP family PP2C-type Ser/Thr phosphatase [Elusimicrobiota bacterium]